MISTDGPAQMGLIVQGTRRQPSGCVPSLLITAPLQRSSRARWLSLFTVAENTIPFKGAV